MSRTRTAAAAAAVALAAVASPAGAAAPKLIGSVSDPLNISFTKSGRKVTHLKAGRFRIVVEDTASDRNFHLKGPGVDRLTPIGGKGTFRWIVTLRKGTYTYVCDVYKEFMKGSFTVS